MTYKPLKAAYPTRQWALIGRRGTGKTAFLGAMRQPILMIDADRHAQDLANRGAQVCLLSDDPQDMSDPFRTHTILRANGAGGCRTVAFDSLTQITDSLVASAMESNRRGINKNKASAFTAKADALRLISSGMTACGVDSVYVWHLEDARDKDGKPVVRPTLPPTERERLQKVLTAIILIDEDGQGRFARVLWSRPGPKGATFYDESGFWAGVPERIEQHLYAEIAATAA
ncbi:hypothetical protein GALL_523460 [mine drainage metagenome]|uniref:Uncharacterized protein n=1 Tax=mine drainage metagenome TaxID=410659 RepID=A0A1J5P4N8_9ZZZZ